MVLAEHDHAIEKLPANAPHESLGYSVLPRALERRACWDDAESLYGTVDLRGEDRVVVEDQIAMRRVVREGISQLLDHPASGWVRSDVEVQDLPPSVVDREPDVEQLESDGGNHEEVHPRDQVPVVSKEGGPALSLAGIRLGSRQVA